MWCRKNLDAGGTVLGFQLGVQKASEALWLMGCRGVRERARRVPSFSPDFRPHIRRLRAPFLHAAVHAAAIIHRCAAPPIPGEPSPQAFSAALEAYRMAEAHL